MGIGLRGERLIFLISQPRAGSTMFQRILGNHPDIYTTTEPWLMLHPIYGLRRDGHTADFNAHWAWYAVKRFLEMFPNGEEEYIEGMRRMYTYIYNQALANSGKRFFLDKTPRYYFIVPELFRIFPKAQFIILLRNPLAVFYSILNSHTFARQSWFLLHNFKADLLQAPGCLLDGINLLGSHGITVQYEHLIENSAEIIKNVCESLGVDFRPDMIDYGNQDVPKWHFGDQEGVHRHRRPVLAKEEKWILALGNPQVWRLTNDYLQYLGPETINRLGYSSQDLQQTVANHRPSRIRLSLTLSLGWFFNKRLLIVSEQLRSLRQRGIRATTAAAARKFVYKLSNPD
jgi:hypothetical protein